MKTFIKRTVDTSQSKKAIFGPTLPRGDQRPPKEPAKLTTQSVVSAADVDSSHRSHRTRSAVKMRYLTGLSACAGNATHVCQAGQIRHFVTGDMTFQNHCNNGTNDPVAWPSSGPNYNCLSTYPNLLSHTSLTFLRLIFSRFV